MKKLLILPLLVLLTSCVTYYYPETALEDGVYYAQDDPSYNVYQGSYPGYAYYPWSSLDYFYMGYHPYPFYTHYHGFHYGYSYGYSPWHYPRGYYGSRYASYFYYPYYPAWLPYNGYCSHYGNCGRRQDNRGEGEQERVVGNNRNTREKPADSDADNREFAADLFEKSNSEYNTGRVPYSRRVSTMPSGYSGNQGMVIRSSDSSKVGKSRIQPDKSAPISNGIVVAAPASTTGLTSGANPASQPSAPVSSTRSSSTRSPSTGTGKAPGRSSTQPVSRSFSTSRPQRSTGSSHRSRPVSSSRRTSTSSSARHRVKRN